MCLRSFFIVILRKNVPQVVQPAEVWLLKRPIVIKGPGYEAFRRLDNLRYVASATPLPFRRLLTIRVEPVINILISYCISVSLVRSFDRPLSHAGFAVIADARLEDGLHTSLLRVGERYLVIGEIDRLQLAFDDVVG